MSHPRDDKLALPTSAPAVQTLFDRLAPRYDLLNHLFSLGLDYTWRWRTTRALAPRNAANSEH